MRAIRLASIAWILLALNGTVGAQSAATAPSGRADAGKALFHQHCSICHGSNADGAGTADEGSFLEPREIPPADLTHLRAQNGGVFPADRVRNAIFNGGTIPLHRSLPDMPGWGNVFYQLKSDPKAYEQRVRDLVAYIETVQVR